MLNSNPCLKLIRSTVAGIDLPDDLSFPFRLDAYFRPPETARRPSVGNDLLVMRGMTLETLLAHVETNGYRSMRHLSSLRITGRDGRVIEHYRNDLAVAA